MKFQFAALVALLSVRSAHAFSARGPASHRFRTTSHRQRVRELVILQVVDDNEYEGFEEEDFVDDGLDGPPLDVRVSKFDSSPSGRLGEVEVIIEQPKTETVRDEPTTVTVANDQEDPSKMRVKEIKAELDSWGVDYDDCFEKTDLVKRLVEARKNPGQQIGQRLKVEMMEEATTLSEQGQKEKAAMQSFGYVGLTEEEFFAMQAAKARESSDHQRGTVKQTPVNQAGTNNGTGGNSRKSVWLEETPEPKKKKKTIKSRSGSSVWLEDTKPKTTTTRQNTGNTINSRSGSSVWLDDTKPSGPPYTTHRKETMQLEDVPAPKKKKRQSTPRVVEPQPQKKSVLEDMLGGGSGSNGANSPVSNGASRQPSILLEDIPSKEIPFGFSGRKKKNSRGPTILQENPNTIRREEPPPKPQQPTADGKGYVGMTEDEYFAQQAAWRSNGMQTAAPMPQKRGVPFGMTEEEFLTQQKAIGIVTETPSSNGSHGVQPPPVREVAQGQAIRGMSEKEFEYWNNRDTHNLGGGANFMGGMNPDQLL